MLTGGSLVGGAIIVILVIVAATSVLGAGGSGDGEYYDDGYYDEGPEVYDGAMTVNQVVDAWLPDDGRVHPADGSRFVAIDITVENDRSIDHVVYVTKSSFRMADSNDFVYLPVDSGASPALPDGLHLESGEKSRGWIVFEVPEDSDIKSLKYRDSIVAVDSISSQ
jgi:hypothetical protein